MKRQRDRWRQRDRETEIWRDNLNLRFQHLQHHQSSHSTEHSFKQTTTWKTVSTQAGAPVSLWKNQEQDLQAQALCSQAAPVAGVLPTSVRRGPTGALCVSGPPLSTKPAAGKRHPRLGRLILVILLPK